MRLPFGRSVQRQRGVLRFDPVGLAELALLALLAVQCARLVYAVATPLGPLGEGRGDGGVAGVSPAVLGAFDPFFRLAVGGGPVVVTALDLKLFGIRSDQATGRGAAIIGLAGGAQKSYSVGEEIVPGVTLKAVAFDGVTVSRGGRDEQLFLDQSHPATLLSAPTKDAR